MGLTKVLSLWRLPLILLVLSGLILAGGDEFRLLLRFDRSDILSGQIWQLMTGHLAHLGPRHFLLNAVGLVLVWFLVGHSFALRDWTLVLLFTLAGVSAGLWFLNPGLEWYVGLSGVLHGLLVAGLIPQLKSRAFDVYLLLGLVLAKLAWEQLLGPLPGSEASSGGNVVVDAHLYGAVSGLALAIILIRLRTRSSI